jgi:DNA-binding transcriptional regulator YhcF (GntR family)
VPVAISARPELATGKPVQTKGLLLFHRKEAGFMENEYIDAALERIDIIGQAGFLIYSVLHRHQDADGMIQTTQREMMALTGLSIGTVNKAFSALRGSGLIAIKRHKNAVTTVQILKSRNSIFDNTSTLLTTTISINDSIKESREVLKNRNLEFDNLRTKNGGFTLADAQDVLTLLTGWIRIPGNPDQAEHALGIVQDIHDRHNSETLEYLRPYWEEFRARYPRSTQIFWLTDWAVQGVIPNRASDAPKKETIFDRELRRIEAEEAARNGG